jgi:glycerol-3-phosphate O-acyltransferase
MSEPASPPVPVREASVEIADPYSAMTPRFNFFFRRFARRFFVHFDLGEGTAARLRELEARGSVVYVMRYASRLDYFLFNTLFLRDGLRLSGFGNGVHFYYYRPVLEGVRLWWRRWRSRRGRRSQRRDSEHAQARSHARRLVLAGESMFLFLRTARIASRLGSRRRLLRQGKSDLDLLEEVVQAVWTTERPVFLVPLALFWRKGPRSERRFLNLAYGAPTRPSDFAKVGSFLITYRDLFVKVGDPIDLAAFVAERRHEGQATLVRKVRRTLLLFLYREEKAVEGPTLRSRHKVQEEVLGDPRMARVLAARAQERGRSVEAARAEAEGMFREIAANMNSSFLATLNVIATTVFKRLFSSIEAMGLEKVAEYAKRHPLVLVPSHRSYFDFMVLSWLFYRNYLVPPLQRSLPTLRVVSAAGGFHPGVLHRGRTLPHRKESGAAPGHALLGGGSLPGRNAARSLLRAHRYHLRAAGGGGGDGVGARGCEEAGRELPGSGARSEGAAPPLRNRLCELR